MEIKTWQKVAFVGSIVAFIVYKKRHAISKNIGDFVSNYAMKWLGTEEVGNNNGFANDVFQAMMKKVGWRSGEQWCMYFAKAIHYDTFPKDREKINKILNGSSQLSFANAKNDTSGTYSVVTSGKPRKGDIVIYQHTNNKATGHAGVVVGVGDTSFTTIEGNTNDKNISDGDLVAKKTRPLAYGKTLSGSTLALRGFIRKNLA